MLTPTQLKEFAEEYASTTDEVAKTELVDKYEKMGGEENVDKEPDTANDDWKNKYNELEKKYIDRFYSGDKKAEEKSNKEEPEELEEKEEKEENIDDVLTVKEKE